MATDSVTGKGRSSPPSEIQVGSDQQQVEQTDEKIARVGSNVSATGGLARISSIQSPQFLIT